MKVDVGLLIGDRGNSHPIKGENKSFLELHGMPLFLHVLQSLENSQNVRRIFIVGEQARLKRAIEQNVQRIKSPERLFLCDQGTNLFENAMLAVEKALAVDKCSAGTPESRREEKVMFYLPGDIPLITSEEIDEFLQQCDVENHDLFAGISSDESLTPFYPTKRDKGIKMACFYVKEKKCRQNNLCLAKPFRIRNRHYIQKMYDVRYQKEFINFIRLLWAFYRAHVQLQGIYYYLLLHWNLLVSRLGMEFLTSYVRQFISMADIERVVGSVVGCKLKVVETKLVGAAIDIDNERDYETIKIMYERWREYQKSIMPFSPLARVGA